jgi:hypothetical protein
MNKEPIQQLREVHAIQGKKGCYDIDDYMLGLYNGLELALSLMEQRDVNYKEREALANHIPDATKMVSDVKDSLTTQQEHGEPVKWPCVIETADFEDDIVTLKMQSKDYSVGVGLHWLSTSLQQRTWFGLTDEEYLEAESVVWVTINLDSDEKEANREFYKAIEAKLRSKNT